MTIEQRQNESPEMETNKPIQNPGEGDFSRENNVDGLIIDRYTLKDRIKDKLLRILSREVPNNEDETVDNIATTVINRFVNKMRKQLENMGIDVNKYKTGHRGAIDLIRGISYEYYANNSKPLKFSLGIKKNKNDNPSKIFLKADDLIDSINLDKVVERINSNANNDNEEGESSKGSKIDVGAYSQVVEKEATTVMEKLKTIRNELTPSVSRWFGATQRTIGQPKENESFRNYLQRALSKTYEINKNLNHPEKENIENALKEIIPLLSGRIDEKNIKPSNDIKITNPDEQSMPTREANIGSINNIIEPNINNTTLNEVLDNINRDNTIPRIDLNEYSEVVEMDAHKALGKMRKLGGSLEFNVRHWLQSAQSIIGEPLEAESLKNYLERAMMHKHEIDKHLYNLDKENIENTLKNIVPILHKSVLLDRMGV